MIVANYTKNEKYLQKGDYRKNFDNANSILELINNIKTNVKETILIRANSKDIFAFKYKYSNNPFTECNFEYEYEIIENGNEVEEYEQPIFDYTLLEEDIDSGVAYSSYKVMSEKYKSVLGEEIYFCRNREILRYIVRDRDALAFLFEDLPELRKNLQKTGNIGERLTVQMFFEDCEDECGCV